MQSRKKIVPSFRGQKSTFGKSSNFVDGFIALIREYDDVWNPSKTFRFADEIGHARKKIQQDTAEKRPAKFKLH